ncbi:MAG TPA: hypothetical protein VGH33_07170 [Isosphaeraceae bacterium]
MHRHHEAPAAKLSPFTLDRMERAVERVRERLERATAALDRARIAYAVAGGHAVAAWVGRVDDSAVRNEPQIDLLVRRDDLGRIKVAFEEEGFRHDSSSSVDLFVHGEKWEIRSAVRLIYENESVRLGTDIRHPQLTETEDIGSFRVLALSTLVRTLLADYRDVDRTHLRDLIDVGLIDESWCGRYPPELAQRLRGILETPEG